MNDAQDLVKSAEHTFEQARGKAAENLKNIFKKVLE